MHPYQNDVAPTQGPVTIQPFPIIMQTTNDKPEMMQQQTDQQVVINC
jgi:hypothetical protein